VSCESNFQTNRQDCDYHPAVQVRMIHNQYTHVLGSPGDVILDRMRVWTHVEVVTGLITTRKGNVPRNQLRLFEVRESPGLRFRDYMVHMVRNSDDKTGRSEG
jgi:uncharacterized iron-regulated membrane protein